MALKTKEKQVRAELAEFSARPLLSELRGDIARMKEEKETVSAQLASLGAGESEAVSPEERAAVEKEWKYWQKQAHVRRRICRDLWRSCSEVRPENMTAEELRVCSIRVVPTRRAAANWQVGISGT